MGLTSKDYMRQALRLGRRTLGQSAPNPAVGCVIVNNKVIVGRGWTQAGGRPHAETQALAMAGDQAQGATVYVTLEPCAHHGRTPPCARALVAAGVAKVVYAMKDPTAPNHGAGAALLRQAGIAVTQGVCATEAQAAHCGFILREKHQRPYVTIKLATYSDGISVPRGTRWITQSLARLRGHLLRAEHDAILVGRATVAQDKPLLTCRLPDMAHASPRPVILDSMLRSSLRLKLLARSPIVFCAPTLDQTRLAQWRKRKVDVQLVPQDGHGLCVRSVMQRLGQLGISRVLIEGGAKTIRSVLRANMADALAWFRPQDTAQPISVHQGFPLAKGWAWHLQSREIWGADVVEFYTRMARMTTRPNRRRFGDV